MADTPKRQFSQRVRDFFIVMVMTARKIYWRQFLSHLGKQTTFFGPVYMVSPERISIGNHCTLNRGVTLNARAPITIGDYVRLAPHVIINTGSLDSNAPPERRGHVEAPVVIQRGAWIAAGAIINPGVVIGEDAVVGAGSVVIQDVPPRTLVFGVPARIVREVVTSDTPNS